MASSPSPAVSPQLQPSAKASTASTASSHPRPQTSLSPRPFLARPLQTIAIFSWPCLLHRPNIPQCCMAQFPAQYPRIPPGNRWPCLCSPCVIPDGPLLPWGQASHFPKPVFAGTSPQVLALAPHLGTYSSSQEECPFP